MRFSMPMPRNLLLCALTLVLLTTAATAHDGVIEAIRKDKDVTIGQLPT